MPLGLPNTTVIVGFFGGTDGDSTVAFDSAFRDFLVAPSVVVAFRFLATLEGSGAVLEPGNSEREQCRITLLTAWCEDGRDRSHS